MLLLCAKLLSEESTHAVPAWLALEASNAMCCRTHWMAGYNRPVTQASMLSSAAAHRTGGE